MRPSMIAQVGALVILAGCPKPPPDPPKEVPRFVAEESCESTRRANPPVPSRPPVDPVRLSPAAEMFVLDGGRPVPVTFLCDLPEHILGIAATQTVDGGKRVVGGTIYAYGRTATGRALPPTVAIDPASAGCKQGELACVFATSSPAMSSIEMVREAWVNTSGWVHGMDDLCRALPDDTIAVCSTATRMAYVELGCGQQLHLGIHDTSLPRAFDMDVEVPNVRLYGAPDPANGGERWSYAFTGGAPYKKVALAFTTAPAPSAVLVINDVREPCLAWAIYRR